MITGGLKSKIDKLWEEFWTGGITNPITVIEQITYLMYFRLIDMNESREEKKARRLGTDFHGLFSKDEQKLRWSEFKQMSGDKMLPFVRDHVFTHFTKSLKGDDLFLNGHSYC